MLTPTISTEFTAPLSEQDAKEQAQIMKALSDPTRLKIISVLARYPGQVSVIELTQSIATKEQPTISNHLRILRLAGIVDCHKTGLWAYYYIRPEALSRAIKIIKQFS